jgi:polyisoprenoid-binding protein YceI
MELFPDSGMLENQHSMERQTHIHHRSRLPIQTDRLQAPEGCMVGARSSSNHERKQSMKYGLLFLAGLLAFISPASRAQEASFQVKAKGIQTFNTQDQLARNQVIFHSKAPLEDIFGAAAGVSGKVSFDPANVSKTIKGSITVQASSMNTGLKKRDMDMLGEEWLDVGRYRTIIFKIRDFTQTRLTGKNSIEGSATGYFTMHGVTRQIAIPLSLTYMEHSPETELRAPGDILVLRSKFSVRFEDYGVKAVSGLVGIRVARSIDLDVNIVATNHVYPESADMGE